MARKPWLVISSLSNPRRRSATFSVLSENAALDGVKRREEEFAVPRQRLQILQQEQHLPRQRYRMRLLHLHALGRHAPDLFGEVDSLHFACHSSPGRRKTCGAILRACRVSGRPVYPSIARSRSPTFLGSTIAA